MIMMFVTPQDGSLIVSNVAILPILGVFSPKIELLPEIIPMMQLTSFSQRVFNMPRHISFNFCIVFLLALLSIFVFNRNVSAQDESEPTPVAVSSVPSCGETLGCDAQIGCDVAKKISNANDALGLYGRADAVFWTLVGDKRPLILRDFGNTYQTAFTANDFQTTRGTPRVLLGVNLTPHFAIEGQYNGFSSWESSRTLLGNSDLTLPGPLGAATDDFFSADRMIVRNETRFHSAELNFVRNIKQTKLSVLAGFRYINFEEKLDINSTFDIAVPDYTSDYRIHAKNDLSGGQLGLKWNPHLTNRFGLDLVGKAGLYGNNARQITWLGDDNNVTVLRNVSMKKSTPAFVGELNLGGHYKITESLTFTGGYNLMWLGDTARAADQLDFTFDANSSHFVGTDTLFMHGANVGLEWNF